MGAFQPVHIIIILVVLVVLFGSTKIPQLMRGIGQGMGEFKKGQEESRRTIDEFKKPDEEKKVEDDKTTADKK